MTQAARNRNALRSQRLIREAFVSLAIDQHRLKPTVADLCREADINRSTFYAHYDNIEDLTDKLFHQYLQGYADWLASALEEDFLSDPLPHLTRLGLYIEENRRLLQAFMAIGARDDSGYGFGMAVRGVLLPVMGDIDSHRLLRFDLICSALTSVYFTWFVGSYDGVTLDEVNRVMAGVILGKRD
ncbi:MAG: TetR/AcrR family transcriptional regulator [Atopobiaceae bacterium]|nr:TetR/AcrR family transcriptional regulator [Atopobiaceae bacterium]